MDIQFDQGRVLDKSVPCDSVLPGGTDCGAIFFLALLFRGFAPLQYPGNRGAQSFALSLEKAGECLL